MPVVNGQTAAAKRLVASLPPDLDQAIVGIMEQRDQGHAEPLVNHSRELYDYRTFFACLDIYDQYSELWSMRPPPSYVIAVFYEALSLIV